MTFIKAYELYKKGIRFYRGIPGGMHDTCLQHPEDRISTVAEKGMTGGDMVNQMLSGFIDSLRAYPKRTRCVCIATNFDEARCYTAPNGAPPDKRAAISSLPCDESSVATFRDTFANADSSRSFIDEFFDPAKRGFKLRSIDDDLDFLRDGVNREVWFAADCLLVRSTLDLESDGRQNGLT